MLKIEEIKDCDLHKGNLARFICMEKFCRDSSNCCALCIKHFHKKCDENLFVDISEIDKRIEIEKSDQIDELRKNVEKIFSEEFEIFFEKLKEKEEFILKGFGEPKKDLKNLTVLDILNYKQFFDIYKHDRNGRICVKNPIVYDGENFEGDIQQFESDLKEKMKIGSDFINELKFYNTTKIMPSFFECHQDLVLKSKFNGVEISRLKETQNTMNVNLFCYSKMPLESTRIKFTLKKRFQILPFIGLIPEGILKNTKKNKDNSIWNIYKLKDCIGVHSSFVNVNGEGSPFQLLQLQREEENKFREDFNHFSIYLDYNKEKHSLSLYSDGNEFNVYVDNLPPQRVYNLLLIIYPNNALSKEFTLLMENINV